MVETIEPDDFDADASKPHSSIGSPIEQAIKQADVSGDKCPGESDKRGERHGERPKHQHDAGSDHLLLTPLMLPAVDGFESALVAVCASPLSKAARRARCSDVMWSRSFTL